ncbi:dihydroxyacetone kinase subunit DhaL [Pseudoroseicyclus aestuarii]|uniref:Homodimeric dihydroxyacetone kinase n=1 Tax=Pseudoroseicyclus aestuarii TaxID=1795041 RepID=A0A318T3N5_9RHOB|nr:dihydroxyacetone kinase subunit DhaL [Pseudoroseicyclus aestuarii]PYE84844.1 homodimeric dihydroxyacetone kinase [Pseudoroseicyclus aestuarii]
MTEETRTKKLINAPEAVIDEMIEGLLAAHPDLLRRDGETLRAVAAVDGPREGKVGIVVGGGSGHEPAFVGYVGRGLADAAAIGNVFASPSPAQVADAVRAADGGAGVLMLYGNYSGDVMNFGMAAEMLEEEGIAARSLLVTDDAASAPIGREGERRGIAGGFFVFKAAGAAADLGHDLDEVARLAAHANARTRSMGVALGACSLPQTRRPNFTIGADEMEIGMGIHGEPGIERTQLETADAVAERLLAPIIQELALGQGDRVAVLVNGLGSTSLMELYILHRHVAGRLEALGVAQACCWVGNYVTALEMAGASLSVLKLDDELEPLIAHPCRTPALQVGLPAAPTSAPAARPVRQRPEMRSEAPQGPLETGGEISAALFRTMLLAAGERVIAEADVLSALDGALGDGDHGVTMETGFRAVARALDALPQDAAPNVLCDAAAQAFLDAVGASAGPLYATGLRHAGRAVAHRGDLDAASLTAWIRAMAEGIAERGGARPGDKTMLDAWAPAAEAAEDALRDGGGAEACLAAAAQAAQAGRDATEAMWARRGRAAKLGDRALGHIDPGAASAALILAAMSAAQGRDI